MILMKLSVKEQQQWQTRRLLYKGQVVIKLCKDILFHSVLIKRAHCVEIVGFFTLVDQITLKDLSFNS